MSYIVSPYLVSIDDLKNAVGSKDQSLALAVLNRRAEDRNETFDENKDDDWNTAAAVKALVNGDLENEKIAGFQYSHALEAFCAYLGKREGVEALDNARFSGDFSGYWTWQLVEQPLIPFKGYNDGDSPVIGYWYCADIPVEIKRTKELQIDNISKGRMQWLQQQAQLYKIQLETELTVFSADFETVTVSPADFPWLDESYYDTVQQELEPLGFNKIHDGELLHMSRAMPHVRNFYRLLINTERNISAAITQVRVVKPETDEQRNMEARCVEFTSEFADGTFLVTASMLGVHNLEYIDGIIFQNCPPDMPLKDLLDYHKMRARLHCSSANTELRTHATDDDLISASGRQFLIMCADWQKKLQAIESVMVMEKPDEELIGWLEEIRTGFLALYTKALETNTYIVTFYY